MSFLSALGDFGLGVANFGLGAFNSLRAMGMQERAWDREDTAVQRRVADLKAAGLSPVLAAGSAATSSAPISVGTPQIDFSFGDQVRLKSDMLRAKADISRTAMETAALKARHAQDFMSEEALQGLRDLEWNGKPFMREYMFRMGSQIQNQFDLQSAQTSAALANAKSAKTLAESRSRLLDFDIRNNLYGNTGRSAQELINLLEKGEGGAVGIELFKLLAPMLLKGR